MENNSIKMLRERLPFHGLFDRQSKQHPETITTQCVKSISQEIKRTFYAVWFAKTSSGERNIVKSKYLIIERDGINAAVVFSSALLHQDIAGKSKIKSAGFCKLDITGNWITFGESVSLGCDARPQDAEILKKLLSAQ